MKNRNSSQTSHPNGRCPWALVALLCGLVTLFSTACGSILDPPPPRETVYPLLEQEAQGLKRDGENISPKLEVELIWDIQSIELVEQADNEKNPWVGHVRFKIISRIKELDDYITEEMDKTFTYVWDKDLEKWLAD